VQLIYFDENKYSDDNPYFLIGGIIVPEEKALGLDKRLAQVQMKYFGTNILSKETELHGNEIFHGKANWKGRKLSDRITVFEDITSIIIDFELAIRIVDIDVTRHRRKYIHPDPEYGLGLMLILERTCDYLDRKNDIGLIFGDYEADEITKSIVDFSEFKLVGRTPMYYGRPLGRLIDTVYFTQSHHSRFLQVADMVIYMASRFENGVCTSAKWHDSQVRDDWEKIKANVDIFIQHWP